MWLPLYHVLLALGIRLGATLDHVRQANALVSTLTPLLLLWVLARSRAARGQDGEPWLPALAAVLAAAVPIGIEIGTTGQPESVFTLLLVAGTAALSRGRLGWAALALSALVLLRYEAWAVALCVALVLGVQRFHGARLSRGALAALLLPGLSIAVWVALRRLGGEPWLVFLRQNQSFAEAALAGAPPRAAAVSALASTLAGLSPGLWLAGLCLLLGVGRTLRYEGFWFVVVPLSLAGFLGLGWWTRSHLGLERHLVCLVPFAAISVAHGVARVAGALTRLGARIRSAGGPVLSPDGCAVLLAGTVLLTSWAGVEARLQGWLRHTETALPDRREAAQFLRGLPATALIVCDEASVELTSGLDASRFVHTYLGRNAASKLRVLAAERDVYALSWAPRLRPAVGLGQVVYGDVNRDGLIGLHVPRQPESSGGAGS